MYLMLVVFLLELAFAFLPSYAAEITVMIAKIVLTVTDEEMNMRNEIKDLKEQQAEISVTDEFARYAKLQRKVDKLMNVLKEKGGERKQHMAYLRMGVNIGIYVVHALVMITLMLMLRNQPLLNLPASWVFPFGKLVAFPTGIPGAVGLGCWVLVSGSVIHRGRALAGV